MGARAAALALCAALAGCGGGPGALPGALPFLREGGPRPEVALDRGDAAMGRGDAEGALRAYRQAALGGGGAPALASMGAANLALGRLGQAEPLLRRAAEVRPDSASAWNNLGVLLLETDRAAEAARCFRLAYALGDGASDAVRDNLILAQAEARPAGAAAEPAPAR